MIGEARADVERDGERMFHQASPSPSSRWYSTMLRSAIACSLATRARAFARTVNRWAKRLCGLQIVGDRHLAANLAAAGDLAVLGLEHRKQAGFDREPRQPDRVVRGRAPAERARHVDVDVARAVDAHRLDHLALEVVQVGDGRGRDIGNAVRDRDLRHALAGAEHVAGLGTDRRRGRGARGRRRRRGALHAGVHVAFVVVADVEHVIVALEHAGQAAEADIGRAAVAALRDGAHLGAALDAHRRRNAGGDRRGIAEQRMQPGDLPRRFRIGRGEHFEAAGGVDRDQLAVGRAHGGIDGIARAERLAASLAGAMAAGQRVRAVDRGLHRALRFRHQPVADREGALLIEAAASGQLAAYRVMSVIGVAPYSAAGGCALSLRRRRMFSAVGPERRTLRTWWSSLATIAR